MGDENSFFNRPWSRVLIILGGTFILYAVAVYYYHIQLNTVLEELLTCLIGLVVWVFFFAQFILPVRRWRDRLAINGRVWLYLGEEISRKTVWRHGPAIFIENGNMRYREGELDERGAGVLWLDSASAVLLRTNTAYTRVEGPGVVFTKRGEYIAATMDLHPITETLGPTSSPFFLDEESRKLEEKCKGLDEKSKELDEKCKEYKGKRKEIDDKRWQTSALTRDGIELVAQISVKYQLDNSRNDSASRFGFNRDAAYAYMTRNIVPNHKVEKPLTSTLPGKLMVDLWREYLRKFTFNELFGYPTGTAKPEDVQPKFQLISGLINDRLNKDELDWLDDYGNKKSEKMIAPVEARQLKEMGLKANFTLKGLYMPGAIEQDLVEKWKANWLMMANKQSEVIDQEEIIHRDLGKQDANRDFGLQASKVLAQNAGSILEQQYPYKASHVVELIVQGHIAGIAQKPDLRKRMTTEVGTLNDIIAWLRERRREGGQHGN